MPEDILDAPPLVLVAAPLPGISSIGAARKIVGENYRKTRPEYAKESGYAVENLKRLFKIGREAGDLPPFDEPRLMPAWWERMVASGKLKQKVPDKILRWAAGGKPEATDRESAKEPTPPSGSSPAFSSSPPRRDDLPARGYAAMLLRAEEAEQIASQAYNNALHAEPFDESPAESLRRACEKAQENLRKLLLSRSEILKGDDEYGRWSDFEEQATDKLNTLNQSLRSLGVRVVTKVAVPTDIFAKLVGALNEELDAIFKALSASGWMKAHEPGEDLTLQ